MTGRFADKTKTGRRLIILLYVLSAALLIAVFSYNILFPVIRLYSAEKLMSSEMSTEEKLGILIGNDNADNESLEEKLNVNTATAEALASLDGIGPKLAEKIYTYRLYNGDFTVLDELLNVTGMGEKTFNKVKDFLTVG